MHTVDEFCVLLFNTNNSIQHYSFAKTQLNGSKYWCISLKIQLKHQSFVCIVLNGQELVGLSGATTPGQSGP